ncbi:MAG: hypothetical protein ABI592_03730 [Acidobacteriota bacterium]
MKWPTGSGPSDEPLARLASETGRRLGDLGVRPEDARWIEAHAETIASLYRASRPARGHWLYRLARRAARTAR